MILHKLGENYLISKIFFFLSLVSGEVFETDKGGGYTIKRNQIDAGG